MKTQTIEAEINSANSHAGFDAGDEIPDDLMDSLVSASKILRYKIINNKKEDMGNIKDIIFGSTTGSISYIILSFGSFLGMSEKLMAIPLDALRIDQEEKQFMLNLDKTKLNSPLVFDNDNWPDMTSKVWSSKVRKFFDLNQQAD